MDYIASSHYCSAVPCAEGDVVVVVVVTILNLITGHYVGPMKPDTKRQYGTLD